MRNRVLVSSHIDHHFGGGGFAIINGEPFSIHESQRVELEMQTVVATKVWVERCQMRNIPTWEMFTAWFEYEGPSTDECGKPIPLTLAVARLLFEEEWDQNNPRLRATLPPGTVKRLENKRGLED